MALSRFVLTANVTVPAGAASAVANGFGTVSWVGAAGAYAEGFPLTFRKGEVIYADSAAGTDTAATLLYQAIGAGNLRAYVQGQDDRGGAALSN